jgi:hypothetical protein
LQYHTRIHGLLPFYDIIYDLSIIQIFPSMGFIKDTYTYVIKSYHLLEVTMVN